MINNLQQLSQNLFQKTINFLPGLRQLKRYDTINWEQEITKFQLSELTYPDYYCLADFHGIKGGYLNPLAAITYDIVTPLATPPNEQWIRQCLFKTVVNKPQKILNLGCGTGSNTILLKKKFPNANVLGLDLSPYMLVIAQKKTVEKNLKIEWRQGIAESTGLESSSYDLITLSMILHETPNLISDLILKESFRLLKSGGQIIILDANQHRLKKLPWLIKLFREPYSAVYCHGNLVNWLKQAGFIKIARKPVWWIYQVTYGIKP